MKSSEVKVGEIYHAKVSGDLTAVRIVREADNGKGWHAVNIKTKRPIRIKSAQRLRKPLSAKEAGIENTAPKRKVTKPRAHPKATASKADAAKKKPKAGGQAQPKAKKADTGKRRGTSGKMSGLDAAAKVLAKAKEPMNTKDMTERMLSKGYWQTKGKTPAATIYAAIIREISAKGDASRFRKAERGKFALASNG